MKVQSMTRCGLLAALTAVCAWLAVPLGEIAVTMQSFAVMFTLLLLGGRSGCLVYGVYLCLGTVGAPVFAGFQGGISVLLGPTGGYLWGFLAAGLLFWCLERRLPPWLCAALSMAVCYLCGTLWYGFVYAEGGLWMILLRCVVPYLLPDALKLVLACTAANHLRRIFFHQ